MHIRRPACTNLARKNICALTHRFSRSAYAGLLQDTCMRNLSKGMLASEKGKRLVVLGGASVRNNRTALL